MGAGVAKAVPGAVSVADAGISPLGSVARWQLSQVVDEGMCEPVPIGLVTGMPTMRVMPAKLLVLPAGWWQAAQLLLMPAWLMREPLKRAPSTTGVAVIEEPAPTWQTSQDAVVGMWFVGQAHDREVRRRDRKDAAAAPWHCAQLLLVLGALAWMLVSVGMVA